MNAKLIISLLAASVGSFVQAQDLLPTYVKAGLGYGWSSDANLHNNGTTGTAQIGSTFSDVDSSPVYDLAAGWNVAPNVRAELSYQYRDGFKVNGTDSALQAGQTLSYGGDIKSQTLMLTGFYDFAPISRVTPFVGLGIGYSHNKISSLTYNGTASGSTISGGNAPGGSKSNFAWQAIAGASIELSQHLALEVSYRYADLGKIRTSSGLNNVSVDGTAQTPFQADGVEGRLHSHEIGASLRYAF